jgi:hypothetical protein
VRDAAGDVLRRALDLRRAVGGGRVGRSGLGGRRGWQVGARRWRGARAWAC